ncbi:hypothetical protein RGUI_1578 [Rhodovulum sp. P5]|nr:hypothetical protein RGUI_1578 [Rhodovulum sp. P5]
MKTTEAVRTAARDHSRSRAAEKNCPGPTDGLISAADGAVALT